MSVLSTLALLVSAAVHREQQAHMKKRASLWPERDGSAAELDNAKAEIEELKAKLRDAEDELELERHFSRGLQQRIWDLQREAIPPIPLGGQHASQQSQALLQQMLAQSQQNAQAAQLHQFAMMHTLENAQANVMIGQQAYEDGLFCNCVPSRAQVWGALRAPSTDGDA